MGKMFRWVESKLCVCECVCACVCMCACTHTCACATCRTVTVKTANCKTQEERSEKFNKITAEPDASWLLYTFFSWNVNKQISLWLQYFRSWTLSKMFSFANIFVGWGWLTCRAPGCTSPGTVVTALMPCTWSWGAGPCWGTHPPAQVCQPPSIPVSHSSCHP